LKAERYQHGVMMICDVLRVTETGETGLQEVTFIHVKQLPLTFNESISWKRKKLLKIRQATHWSSETNFRLIQNRIV
jgi:hypothetical protein